MRLSRYRDSFGPQRLARTLEQVQAAGLGEFTIAKETHGILRSTPIGVPADHPALLRDVREVVPRVVLAELPHGRVLGPYRAVLAADGTFVGELSPYFGANDPLRHPVLLSPMPAPPVEIKGTVIVLAARADVSYYHFLLDVLPRLALVEDLLTRSDARLYLPMSLPFQRELVELIGIDPCRVIDSDAAQHIRADQLIVPGLPDPALRTPRWTVDFLRRRLPRPPVSPGTRRRIYLTRGTEPGNRIVVNEAALVGLLMRAGFEAIDSGRLSVVDQIRLFSEAELIVAPHGGALTNLLFAEPGTAVVELFAPDYVQGCYWKLCDCLPGVEYRYVVGSGRTANPARMWGVDSDITVDLGAVAAMLNAVLRTRV
jgi:capsular polysaccharide biosynthesis protein